VYHSAILLLFQFFLCLYITFWFFIFLLCVLLLKYFLCIISLFASSCEKLYLFRLVANAIDVTFSKGDAIAIDMQMTVNAVILYLAIVLAGCVVWYQ